MAGLYVAEFDRRGLCSDVDVVCICSEVLLRPAQRLAEAESTWCQQY